MMGKIVVMDLIYAIVKMCVLICRHSYVIKVFRGKRASSDSQFVNVRVMSDTLHAGQETAGT